MMRSACLAMLVVLAAGVRADAAQPAPQRRFASENREFELEIEPGRPGRQPARPCKATLWFRGEAKRAVRWTASLPHPVAPLQAAVRDDGQFVVALGDHPDGGLRNALTVCDRDGRTVKQFRLPELLDREDWRHVRRRGRGVDWLEGARGRFETSGEPAVEQFVLDLRWKRQIRIDLQALEVIREAGRGPSGPDEIPPEILALLEGPPADGPGEPGVEFAQRLSEAVLARQMLEALRAEAQQLMAESGSIPPELQARIAEAEARAAAAERDAVPDIALVGPPDVAPDGVPLDDAADGSQVIHIRAATAEEALGKLRETFGENVPDELRLVVLESFANGGQLELVLKLAAGADRVDEAQPAAESGAAPDAPDALARPPAPAPPEPGGMLPDGLPGVGAGEGGEGPPVEPPLAEQVLGRPIPAPNLVEPTDYLAWFNELAATDGPSAAPLYQSATERFVAFEGDTELLSAALSGDPEALQSPEVSAWIEANRAALEDLRVGNRLDYNGMVMHSEGGDMVSAVLPYLSPMRGLTRALVADGRRLAAAGDVGGAIDAYLEGITAGRQTGRGRTLIEGLVGQAMEAAATDALLDTIATSGDGIDYAALSERLEGAERESRSLAELVQFERVMYLDSMQRSFEIDPVSGRPVAILESWARFAALTADDPDYALMKVAALGLDYEETVRSGNAYYDALTRALQQPYPQSRAMLDELEREVVNASNPLLGVLIPSLARAGHVVTRGEAARRGTLLVTRIRAFEQQHGRLPDSLDELGPGPAGVDPFSGQPFVYAREGGGFRLYSIGGDGVDDGGAHDPRADSGDLLIWPRPRD